MVMRLDAPRRGHQRRPSRAHPPEQRRRKQQLGTASLPQAKPQTRVAHSLGAAVSLETAARFRPWVLDRLPLLLLVADLVALALAAVFTDIDTLFVQVFAIGTLAVFQARRLYRPRLTLALSDDLLMLLGGVTVGAVAATAVFRASGAEVSMGKVGALAAVAAALLVAGRAGAYAAIRAARRRGWATHRAIVVGTDETAARLAETLEDHPDHGLRVVGFVGSEEAGTPASVRDATLAHDPAMLPVLTRRHRAGVVLMTLSGVNGDDVLRSLRMWGPPGGLTVFLVPPLFHMLHGGGMDRVRDIALIPIRASVTRRLAWRAKALLDTSVAATLLLLLAPVMLLVAAAVRWETKSCVLFKQTRIGLGGRPFTLYKFCSMRPATETESAQNWSVAGDDRLGPIGRFIRKSSLDELPQLINVVKGEMSLVGPRPERPYFVEQFGNAFDDYDLRHRVRPGLTGWAAVNGLRGDTSIQERAYFDNVYIDNWTLHFDLKILAMTALAVLKGTGA